MNKPIIYIPISAIILLSILYISLSVPSYSLLLNFLNLIYLALPLAIIVGLLFYFKFKSKMDFDNLYILVGSSVLFSFIVGFAFISFCNTRYATKNCNSTSYQVVSYKGRMSSGYGKLKKGEIKANQWVMTIVIHNKKKTFVLNKDITNGQNVTNTLELEFCKGLLGTKFLNIKH